MTTNPSNFSMTLGTAKGIVAKPAGWKPEQVAEARRVVAYWAKRAVKAAARHDRASTTARQLACNAQRERAALFTQIAKEHLLVETLEVRNSDSLDFHDVSVGGIRAALQAAYNAGVAAQARSAK